MPPVPIAILDTNVVLDLLVFRDAGCTALHSALARATVRWTATAAMRDELACVLARGGFEVWRPDLVHIWSQWDHHCAEWLQADPAPAQPRIRCADPDDQKFVDLALACGARWLFSRDRELLKLTRHLAARGVDVLTPAEWHPAAPTT